MAHAVISARRANFNSSGAFVVEWADVVRRSCMRPALTHRPLHRFIATDRSAVQFLYRKRHFCGTSVEVTGYEIGSVLGHGNKIHIETQGRDI